VGLITLSLIPVSFLLNWIMYTVESNMYKKQNLHVRKNILGFFIYTVFYSIVMQPITLAGYFYELFGARKIWGVK
jgi:biofilm PGA synthesis N-glycosyltransferase PgaC